MAVRTKVFSRQEIGPGAGTADIGNADSGETWILKQVSLSSTVSETVDLLISDISGAPLFPLLRQALTANVPVRIDLWVVLGPLDFVWLKTMATGGTRRVWVSGAQLAGVAP